MQSRKVICSAGSHPRPGLRAPGAWDFIPFLVGAFYCFLSAPFAFDPTRRRPRSRPNIPAVRSFSHFFFCLYLPLFPQHQQDFQWSFDRLMVLSWLFSVLKEGRYLHPQRLEPMPRTDQPLAPQALRRMKNVVFIYFFKKNIQLVFSPLYSKRKTERISVTSVSRRHCQDLNLFQKKHSPPTCKHTHTHHRL